MNKGPRRHPHAKRHDREKSRETPAVAGVAAPIEARTSRRRTFYVIALGLLIVGAVTGTAFWKGGSDSERDVKISAQVPTKLSDADEPKVREVCSRCHQLPAPDVLPRAAWEATVWQMFQESGYGTTVKWPFDPESVVAWFQDRAPEQFTFPIPVTSQSQNQDRETLLLATQSINARPAASPPVVSNILVASVVGDGRPELIVCDMLNGRILMGRTGESDWTLEPIAEVANPAHVEAVDLDEDGRIDLVVANLGSYLALDHNLGSVEWLRQSDDGTFERTTLVDGLGRTADVQPDDFDGDGDVDLVVAEFGWRSTGHLLLLENRSTPGQSVVFERHDIDGLHGASHVDVADLDGDGLRDLVVLYSQGHEMVRCYLQRGDYVFAIHDLYRAPSPAWGFSGSQMVDLDQDGDLDILLTNGDTFDNSILKPYHGIQWLENKGQLRFEPHQLATLYGAYRAEAADLDGDGDVDIAACALIAPGVGGVDQLKGELDSIVWFEQRSAGEFVRHTLESDQCHHPTLTLGDYDLDGDVDLLVGNGQLHFTAVPSGQSCLDLWENKLNPRTNTPK